MRFYALFVLISFAGHVSAQTATLRGTISSVEEKVTLPGADVYIQGTSHATIADENGNYEISGIKPGEYNIEFTFLGYETVIKTGVKLVAGGNTLDIALGVSAVSIGEDVVIRGEKPLVDIEDPRSGSIVDEELIGSQPNRQLQNILNTQTGVINNPEGVHIRGGRTYETGFYIDNISASDPLAGTGFGIDLGTNSIKAIEVTTGGSGAEFGNATAGVVNTKTKTGSDKFELSISHKRDNFGFNEDWNSVFNTSVYELGMGGPAGKHLKYFLSFKGNFTDEFTKNPADQLYSSIYPGSTFFSPLQDNRWAGLLNLNYQFKPGTSLSFSYLRSITINQNRNMLRITGNDVSFSPGYQFLFSLQPDNANTYTHDTNLESLKWRKNISKQATYQLTLSRLFVKLRADANGRDWRPAQVDTEFDPSSITTYPTEVFNPNDSIVFVNPGPGLYNNNGIATLWHDHYVEEYTIGGNLSYYSKNAKNKLQIGTDVKLQEMQWIDIVRPWIGAPINLPDGSTTQSFRLGDYSDIWKVNPTLGSIYVTDRLKYIGLIAEVGFRFEYWMPGAYVDDAVNNPDAPIRDEVRNAYMDETFGIAGRRVKARLLPKVSASFPVSENQMLFFNYSHSTKYPHPSYIYAGLDPFYTDRSAISQVGNPNLNPEVDISYELGLKSQLTSNDALNINAYWKDKYDFITATSILLEDQTGRETRRTMRINSDYARIRGIEVAYIKRIGKWFSGQISVSYSAATGQSSSSSETIRDIVATGNRETTQELPLAWDSPLDAKLFTVFTYNQPEGMWGVKGLNQMSAYFEAIYRTGKRYTPYIYQGDEPVSGRPIYEINSDPSARYSELGTPLFWINMNAKKWWTIKETELALTIEVTNVLNRKNAAIINPVTGKAYEAGDPVPSEWRDPSYIDPRDPRSYGIPSDDPSRYYKQRHFLVGIEFRL